MGNHNASQRGQHFPILIVDAPICLTLHQTQRDGEPLY